MAYRIEWDGADFVRLPPLPRFAEDSDSGLDFLGTYIWKINKAIRALELSHGPGSRDGKYGICMDVVLVPRPDSPSHPTGLTIAALPENGGNVNERHFGYVDVDALADDGATLGLHELARYGGGQIHAAIYFDPNQPWGTFALPDISTLTAAVWSFLRDPHTPPLATRPALDLRAVLPQDEFDRRERRFETRKREALATLHNIQTDPPDSPPLPPLSIETMSLAER